MQHRNNDFNTNAMLHSRTHQRDFRPMRYIQKRLYSNSMFLGPFDVYLVYLWHIKETGYNVKGNNSIPLHRNRRESLSSVPNRPSTSFCTTSSSCATCDVTRVYAYRSA